MLRSTYKPLGLQQQAFILLLSFALIATRSYTA